jgi:large subunit ribosomal protein L23
MTKKKEMSILERIIGKKRKKGGKELEEKASQVKAVKKSVAKEKEKSQKPQKEVKVRRVAKKEENIAHKVLLERLISEKSTRLAAENKYVFKVDPKAGKNEIKEAIEGYYGVQVVKINTIKIKPKKRIHGRTIGWKKGFKKAVVTLREGDTIEGEEG